MSPDVCIDVFWTSQAQVKQVLQFSDFTRSFRLSWNIHDCRNREYTGLDVVVVFLPGLLASLV